MPLFSSQVIANEDEMRDGKETFAAPQSIEQSCVKEAAAPLFERSLSAAPTALPGEQLTREAALCILRDPLPPQCSRLQKLSLNQWQHLLRWLDLSGLALNVFDRLCAMRWIDILPGPIFGRLQQNLEDNTRRTHGMIAESVAIQQEFQADQLRYAVLKGLSFWPCSVPKPELRSQFDLDFLVAPEAASAAQRILEQRGYRLYAISGRSWEFKRNERPGISLKDLYKDLQSWTVELHLEPTVPSGRSQLERVEWRDLFGFRMPGLMPVDLFVGQGLHAYKHVCGEFVRAAHLEEFRRHVLFRQYDNAFWDALYLSASEDQQTSIRLGVVTLLITQVMGEFAPEALTDWTVRRLPKSAQLWVQMYGHRAVLGSFPGSKLYLLLQRRLADAGVSARRSIRQSLIPFRLPPLIIRPLPNETLLTRLARHRMQLNFIVHRLRFHVVEGLRYCGELHRWRRRLNQIAKG